MGIGRSHPDANVFRRLEQRLRKTRSATPTAHVNAGRPPSLRIPRNGDAMTAAVEIEPWGRSLETACSSSTSWRPWFYVNCSTGTAWRRASSCNAEVVVSARGSSSALWGRCPAVVEGDLSRKVDWTVRDDCMVSSVAGSNSDGHFFLWGHLKEHVYAVPHQVCRRSRGKTSSSGDNRRYQHVNAYSRECRVAHYRLSWYGRRILRLSIVTIRRPWFDHLTAGTIWWWRVSWKLNVTRHILYHTAGWLFNKASQYGKLVS
jgi:hypothetical protein